MFTKAKVFSLVAFLAAAAALLTVVPNSSRVAAQDAGADTVGAWLGTVFVAPGAGFPFQAHFGRDGTWTASDARGFGAIALPFPFTATATGISGSWVRTAPRVYGWTGTQILLNPSGNAAPAGYYVLVVRGSHEIAAGDFDHAINGTAGAKIFPCGPTAFGCPSPDTILSNPDPFVPTFTFTLSRVRPQ